MTHYYQIQSPLSEITEATAKRYLETISARLSAPLQKVPLETYLQDDFALLFVASGGSEGYFLEIFDALKGRPCWLLTSGDSNSLAASLEILSFLNAHGGRGEVLHGDPETVARRIEALSAAHKTKAALRGRNLGYIGTPSDWLIASSYSTEAIREKLGMECLQIPMEELLAEIAEKEYVPDEYTERFLREKFPREETEKALSVYGAFARLAEKYRLSGLTVRCFDLLDSVHTTGCLGLSILNDRGIAAGCEGDVPSLLSMMILGNLSGEPVFMCNPSRFDTKAGTALFAHCTVPVSVLQSFSLNTHFESGIGAAVQGVFREGPCTVFKTSGELDRYHVQEGVILPTDYSETLCRTQVLTKLPDLRYFLTRPIHNHHVIVRGRHAGSVQAFFELLGGERV